MADPQRPAFTRALEPHLTIREVAGAIKVHPRTITRLAARGQFPRPLRIGTLLRWRQRDVAEFLDRLAEG